VTERCGRASERNSFIPRDVEVRKSRPERKSPHKRCLG
jgi:hypothetical protein